jgi:hypothetical protein
MITRKRLRVIITSVQKPRRTLFSNWEYCSEGYSSAIVKTARTARVDRSGRQPRDASDWNWDKVVPDAMAFDKPIYRSRIYLVMTKPASQCIFRLMAGLYFSSDISRTWDKSSSHQESRKGIWRSIITCCIFVCKRFIWISRNCLMLLR